jgi:hypothetical protein
MIPPRHATVIIQMTQRVRLWVLVAVLGGMLVGCGGAGAPSTNPGSSPGQESPSPRYDY